MHIHHCFSPVMVKLWDGDSFFYRNVLPVFCLLTVQYLKCLVGLVSNTVNTVWIHYINNHSIINDCVKCCIAIKSIPRMTS